MSFHAYLFFNGTCRAAMTRYQEIFGGDLHVMNAADAPAGVPEGECLPADDRNLVMHAALQIGGALLMASDDPSGDGGPMRGAAVSYSAANAGEVKRIVDALAEGGAVTMPVEETFWSPAFGACTDRFGVAWMVGVDAQQV